LTPLQVSTPGGRVKIFGRDGVERCMLGAAAATRQLRFFDNRGALVRVDADGQIELFQVEAPDAADAGAAGAAPATAPSPPLARLQLPDGDAATCAEPAAREPFLLIGCRSGAVRVAAATNASGNPAAAARQARGLSLMPYTSECVRRLMGNALLGQKMQALAGKMRAAVCCWNTLSCCACWGAIHCWRLKRPPAAALTAHACITDPGTQSPPRRWRLVARCCCWRQLPDHLWSCSSPCTAATAPAVAQLCGTYGRSSCLPLCRAAPAAARLASAAAAEAGSR
jgi:hypothetical protein